MTMTRATQARLWYAQRLSAMVLAGCVIVHLGVIVYATRSGLSAGALLARTRGNVAFGVFYGVFVLACAVHAPLGLRAVAHEWLRWRGGAADAAWAAFALAIVATGMRAVYAVTAA